MILQLIFLIGVRVLTLLRSGYFISPEITLFPYLTKNGFLPYQNILDQHFPAIFFGPFSIPYYLVHSQQSATFFFFLFVIITDLLLYLLIIKTRGKSFFVLGLIWLLISNLFQVNTFWLESFIIFLLLIHTLTNGKNDFYDFISALPLSLVLIARPLLFPAVFVLLAARRTKLSRFFIIGLAIPIVITIYYLARYNLLTEFKYLVLDFNSSNYAILAKKLPTLGGYFKILLFIIVPSYLFSQNNRLYLLSIFASLISIFPRFELFHLLPSLILMFISIIYSHKKISGYSLAISVSILVLLNMRTLKSPSMHDYYYSIVPQELIHKLNMARGNTLFLIGAPDLLYPITGKIPPSNTYLPALPWYYNDNRLTNTAILSIMYSPLTTVVINQHATVDGKNIFLSSGELGKYIISTFEKRDQVGDYEIYQKL